MATLIKPHQPHHELRAFGAFYGTTIAATIALRMLIAPLLPAPILQEYGALVWTASFLGAAGLVAWLFERHRRRHAG